MTFNEKEIDQISSDFCESVCELLKYFKKQNDFGIGYNTRLFDRIKIECANELKQNYKDNSSNDTDIRLGLAAFKFAEFLSTQNVRKFNVFVDMSKTWHAKLALKNETFPPIRRSWLCFWPCS